MATSTQEKEKVALDEKRRDLLLLIDQYHEKEALFFSTTLLMASVSALSKVNEKINQKQDAEIAELRKAIEKLNENQSSGSVLLDIAFLIITGPVLGKLVDVGLRTIATLTIRRREKIKEISNVINKAAGQPSAATWHGVQLGSKEVKQIQDIVIEPSKSSSLEIPLQKVFDYWSPFAIDVAKLSGQKAYNALAKTSQSGGPSPQTIDVKELYKDKYAINELPISNFTDGVQNYILTQLNINLSNKFTLKWLVITVPVADFLDLLSLDMSKKMQELQQFSDVTLKTNLSMLLEAIVWIYYLGKPNFFKI